MVYFQIFTNRNRISKILFGNTLCNNSSKWLYQCSFFTGVTGPMAKATDLPSYLEEGTKAIELCEAHNPYYDVKCRKCRALPICGEYCALTPVTDTNSMDSFCNAQVTLRALMDQNAELTELIAKRFIEHKRVYPADMPKSCGMLTKEG